jgi:uncharacterized damage-inducible protein DinB
MTIKQFLLQAFKYNLKTNGMLLRKIEQMGDPEDCIKMFSHLINCQIKWLARINNDSNVGELDWWVPVYEMEELESAWINSNNNWLDYLKVTDEYELSTEVEFSGYDGGQWAATPLDIAIQLNFHNVHHRAQMQMMLRSQGIKPAFVDYIGTRYRKIS